MIELSLMTLRDLPLFNTVRNASREWLTDKTAYTLPEAVEWFRREPREYLVVLFDKVPVGYCRVTGGADETEKWVGMDIHPDYRGRGLAREVYAQLFAILHAVGVRRFRLTVRKENARARHIYDTLGFVEVKKRGDEIEMVLEEREGPYAA